MPVSKEEAFLMVAAQLAFECQRCGHCCKDMYVYSASEEEARKLEELGYGNFLEKTENGICLKAENGVCPLYVEGIGCSVYQDRPSVCRKYPCENWDPELGGFKFHIYECCPGSMKLLDEIKRLHEGKHDTAPYIWDLLETAFTWKIASDDKLLDLTSYLESNKLMSQKVFDKWIAQDGFKYFCKRYIADRSEF